MDLDIKGLRVLVTAGANGIGLAIARRFAAEGAKVHTCDVDEIALSELSASDPDITWSSCDVSDRSSVQKLFAEAVAKFGGLDVLVNCAGGYGRLATVEDMALDEWDSTIALNLRSVFLMSRAAIPHLKKSRAGRIINVASISGRAVTVASSPAYGSAKAAVIQLTRFLAQQLGPDGITANAIAPITTLTPRVLALRTREDIERIAAQVPLKRLASSEDHCNAMLFLASDAASYINGVALDVNGGRVMM